MISTIPVAHDFICPWCWVGFLQTQKLKSDLGVSFDWQGYELFPEELAWPERTPTPPPPANKPAVLSRFDFLLVADGIEMPIATKPPKMRTFFAHEAVEYAKTIGAADQMIQALYEAYWLRGENINDVEVIAQVSQDFVQDQQALRDSVTERRYRHLIVGFDDDAYARGIYNVPTFTIGDTRYAEQPLVNLRKAIEQINGSNKS